MIASADGQITVADNSNLDRESTAAYNLTVTVTDGANLLSDPNIAVILPPSANHRQLWFNTQLPEGGAFTDPRVRQAVCYAVNRQQIVDTIYEGEALVDVRSEGSSIRVWIDSSEAGSRR